MADQPAPDGIRADRNPQPSGWRSNFDRKQIVTSIISALFGATFVLMGVGVQWLWSTSSEIQETRLLDKIRKDDTLANNIKTKVIDSAAFSSVKTDVDEIKKQITDIKVNVSRIEGSLKIAKANALGIPNPKIQQVTLFPQEQFNSLVPLSNKRSVFIQFTIVGVEGDVVTIRTDGRDWNNKVYSNNLFKIRAVPGAVYNLSTAFPLTLALPRILFAILGRPTSATLDVAIGAAETPTG